MFVFKEIGEFISLLRNRWKRRTTKNVLCTARREDRLIEYYVKTKKRIFIIYFARAGRVEDFCFGVWPAALPKRFEAEELILVFGERKDVVLVLKVNETKFIWWNQMDGEKRVQQRRITASYQTKVICEKVDGERGTERIHRLCLHSIVSFRMNLDGRRRGVYLDEGVWSCCEMTPRLGIFLLNLPIHCFCSFSLAHITNNSFTDSLSLTRHGCMNSSRSS